MLTFEESAKDKMLSAIVGKEVAITGTLPIPRAEMIDWIHAHGGYYHDRVRYLTNTLIVGELPGFISRKLRRANELNAREERIVILDGTELLARNEENGDD